MFITKINMVQVVLCVRTVPHSFSFFINFEILSFKFDLTLPKRDGFSREWIPSGFTPTHPKLVQLTSPPPYLPYLAFLF